MQSKHDSLKLSPAYNWVSFWRARDDSAAPIQEGCVHSVCRSETQANHPHFIYSSERGRGGGESVGPGTQRSKRGRLEIPVSGLSS